MADERAELIARAFRDFELFCKALVQIRTKEGQRSYLKFNNIQRKYNAVRTNRDVVLKPRQIGFSTLEIARDVYKFLQPGQSVLLFCQTDKDGTYKRKFAADIDRIFEGLRRAGLVLNFSTDTIGSWALSDRDSFLQIVEAGASEAAASKKGRGGTYTRIHSTEAAFYEFPEQALNAALEGVPSLPDTEIVFESTPNGVNNWFHQMFTSAQAGTNGYRAHFFAWYEDPTYRLPLLPGERITPRNEREHELVEVHGIDQEQLKWYRAKVEQKGQDLTDQEYASDPIRTFLVSGRLYFDLGAIDRLAGNIKPPVYERGSLFIWERPKPMSKYVIGVDTAEGLGEDGDDSVAIVRERKTRAHVATIRSKMRANPFADELVKIARDYNEAEISFERNKGMALFAALERIGYYKIYYDHDNKPGIFTSASSRPVLLENLAEVVRDGSFVTNDPVQLSEMRGFVIDARTGRPYAPSKKNKNGISDDSIFADAMCWHTMLTPSTVTRYAGIVGDNPWGDANARGF
jgi:hypothetical protein